MKKNFLILIALSIVFSACDPNKDLYDDLDALINPYNEAIEYTLITEDYNSIGDEVRDYQAFSDSFPAMDYIPELLARKYIALNMGSRALVTFNHLVLHPIWWDAGFGYELTDDDYQYIGVGGYFSESNPASNHLPDFLIKEYPDAVEGDEVRIIYSYSVDGDFIKNLDIYEFDGNDWILIETIEDIPYVGYELTDEDYETIGGSVAQHGSFSGANDPDLFIPGFLNFKFPLAPINAEQVVKYKFYNGSQTLDVIDKYVYNGYIWDKVSMIEERTEQYIFGQIGWAFDPTVTFLMFREDYNFLASIDPIPHPVFDDFGYYYGASAYYRNFDIRLLGRRLNTDDNGNYFDPELASIYENEGPDAAMDEIYRRILEEGFVLLLQHKFPDATPQVGGIDVHYIVQFETFGDGFMRTYPEAEYKCIEAGDPPQFEFIEGPRDRTSE